MCSSISRRPSCSWIYSVEIPLVMRHPRHSFIEHDIHCTLNNNHTINNTAIPTRSNLRSSLRIWIWTPKKMISTKATKNRSGTAKSKRVQRPSPKRSAWTCCTYPQRRTSRRTHWICNGIPRLQPYLLSWVARFKSDQAPSCANERAATASIPKISRTVFHSKQ